VPWDYVDVGLAAVFGLGGLRSLVHWSRIGFDAEGPGDLLLYTVHVTARVGLWFGFAGLFVGYGLLEEPRSMLTWFIPLLIGLAGVQFLTAVFLGRWSRSSPTRRLGVGTGGDGQYPGDVEATPGPGELEPEKRGQSADPGRPQPEAAEVESARLLANDARPALRSDGFSDEQIRRMADEYIALDLGEDLDGFVRWARQRSG
jgi:hypothetical protein